MRSLTSRSVDQFIMMNLKDVIKRLTCVASIDNTDSTEFYRKYSKNANVKPYKSRFCLNSFILT